MSDPVTALAGASFEGLVTIRDADPQGMIALRGDLDTAPVQKAIAAASEVKTLKPRAAAMNGATGALWMSPDEVMVLCPYAEAADRRAAMQDALGKAHALVVDLSDARAMVRIEGTGVREVLAKLTPADMRASALPVGELRRTRLAQVAAAFWLEDEQTAHLICFRSVARYVFDLLNAAAAPGSEVGYFDRS